MKSLRINIYVKMKHVLNFLLLVITVIPEFDIYFKNGPLEVLKTLKSYFHFQKM
jgi:hypothetical protein